MGDNSMAEDPQEGQCGYAYDHIGDSIGRSGSYKINYDPLVMADGIAPTDDPVQLFRSPSYATSYTRRLRDL